MQRTGSIVTALSYIFVLGLSANAANKTLADYKSLCEEKMSKIDAAHHASQKAALDSYRKALAVAKETLKRDGDLEGTIAAIQEINRFREESSVPRHPSDGLPSLIISVQKSYHTVLLSAERVKNHNTVALIKRYLVPLERLKKQLVQQEQLDEAREVADEIKRVDSVLADIELALPPSQAASVGFSSPSRGFPASLRKGLVLHYSFDKDEGKKVTDKSQKRNDGTVHGAKWTSRGKVGGACVFDGRDDSVVVADSDTLDMNKAFTVALWCYVKEYNRNKGAFLVSKGKYPSYNYRICIVRKVGNKLAVGIGNQGKLHEAFDKGSVPTDTWVHIAGSFYAGELMLYNNGVLVSKARTPTRNSTANDRDLVIGKYGFGPDYEIRGMLDEIMIWNRQLSGMAVKQLYNSQK